MKNYEQSKHLMDMDGIGWIWMMVEFWFYLCRVLWHRKDVPLKSWPSLVKSELPAEMSSLVDGWDHRTSPTWSALTASAGDGPVSYASRGSAESSQQNHTWPTLMAHPK